MKTKSFLYIQLAVIVVLVCAGTAVCGQTTHFKGRKAFLPYTRNLPKVDKVELFKLTLKDDKWTGAIDGTRVMTGSEARKVASLWRRQTYDSSTSACHEPAYAIKFYFEGKVIAYASICWGCNSILMITPDLGETQSFGGGDKHG